MSSSSYRPIILCLIPYYLPAYRSGGPVRSLSNLVSSLGGEYHFKIITNDRDVGDKNCFKGLKVGTWQKLSGADVYYVSPSRQNISVLTQLIRDTPHDILYLNSFFSLPFTILPLLSRRFGFISRVPTLIAPRGELSRGSLKIRSLKKSFFVFVSRILGLYRGLCWHACSIPERDDILRFTGSLNQGITVSPNIPSPHILTIPSNSPGYHSTPDCLKLVFLSRLSPKKNLDFLLTVLAGVTSTVYLTIYGPIEDRDYWAFCQTLISKLPLWIRVSYEGSLLPEEVVSKLSKYDLFVLPTKSENFGHVILESLSAGTPVLISDQTPWRSDSSGGIEELPLDSPSQWQLRLSQLSHLNHAQHLSRRRAAVDAANRFRSNQTLVPAARDMFQHCLNFNV